MTPVQAVMVAVLLLAAPLAYGQDTQQAEGPEATAAPPARVAIPRGQARTADPAPRASAPVPQRAPQRRPPPVAAPPQPAAVAPPAPVAAAAAPADEAQRRRQAVPRGSRPRGDNPATGVAVPRETRRPPSSGGGVYRNGGVYRSGSRGYTNYNNFYVYPRRYYPYGYGGFGLGFFYYDPYRWFPGYYGGVYSAGGPYGYGGYYGGGYGGGYGGYGGYGYDVGQLRLRVTPRHAEVYVDGYFAGMVDDYDGIAQSLTLESGPYRIELVAPGYEPLEFNVRISPGQKVTYRGDLRLRP
jgi:hypothetical protein